MNFVFSVLDIFANTLIFWALVVLLCVCSYNYASGLDLSLEKTLKQSYTIHNKCHGLGFVLFLAIVSGLASFRYHIPYWWVTVVYVGAGIIHAVVMGAGLIIRVQGMVGEVKKAYDLAKKRHSMTTDKSLLHSETLIGEVNHILSREYCLCAEEENGKALITVDWSKVDVSGWITLWGPYMVARGWIRVYEVVIAEPLKWLLGKVNRVLGLRVKMD